LLLKAAKQLESLDLDLARDTYLDALSAAQLAGPAGAGARLEVCRAARALPPPARPPRPIDLLLGGLALLVTEGRAAAAPTLRDAARVFVDEGLSAGERLRWGWLASAPTYAMWDNEATRAVLARQIQLIRDAGALEQLPIYLSALGTATARTGDFAAAASLIAETKAVAAAIGARLPPFTALVLVVRVGRETEASTVIRTTIDQAEGSGQEAAVTMAQYAATVVYNGLRHYEEAMTAAQQACWDIPSTCMVPGGHTPGADGVGRTLCAGRAGPGCARAAGGGDTARRRRLGAGDRGAVACAVERGCRR
jgi:hypothetical protein